MLLLHLRSLNNIFGLLKFLRHPPLGVMGGARLWRQQYRAPILAGDADAGSKLADIIAEVSGLVWYSTNRGTMPISCALTLLRACVCIYVYVCVRVCVCIYVYVYACMYVCMCCKVMVRHTKEEISAIPKPQWHIVHLSFSDNEAKAYNTILS